MAVSMPESEAKPMLGAYYQSWSAQCVWWPDVYCDLSKVSSYVDQVFISFASPSNDYNPNNANCLGTQFPTPDPKALKLSLQKLRQSNPNVQVFLSVGGATFPFPSSRMSQSKIQGILKYIDQYDLDGIDLDYENEPGC
jgi:GH18 family chitinase